MRQNPMLQNRAQVGGRSMPAWFSASLVTQSRVGAPSPPPPPLPAEPPPVESDYEEIDHLPKSTMKKAGSRRACSLCGNPNPAVSCEMCNNQIFCGSCNDMYHRHPKRQHHSRRILEPLDNRPPLPPKTPIPQEMIQAQLPPLPPQHPSQYPANSGAVPTPQPPPRRKGRFGMRSAAGSPTPGIKSFFDPVGTLKRFMGGMAHRPLPPTPKPPPPLPPKPSDLGRSTTPTPRAIGDRRLSSPQPGGFPQQSFQDPRGRVGSAFEMQNARMHSLSVANLSGHGSRDSGYPDWEEDEEEIFARNRAHSISRFPSTSQDASHFATMHRPGRNQRQPVQQLQNQSQDAPERPPPPLPPRQFPSQTQLSFQNSRSAFDLDQMAAVAQQQQAFGMPPWNYPMPGYPFDFQQAMMMGYPGGTMHRTPSTQSMGPSMNPSANPNQAAFFGWGPMGFGPPMSQMEMDMMAAHQRRGSDINLMQQQQQSHPSQRGVPLSNPVTPQGSFRKKTGRHMSVEPELSRRLERGLDLTQTRRSGTPSSFVRVQPSSSSTSTPAPSISSSSGGRSKPPAKPPSEQSPDDSYFSAEKQQLTESSGSNPELTETPEGPWECEHCTFINPKSTKVCTICCKTPSEGYKVIKGNRRASNSAAAKAKAKAKANEMMEQELQQQQNSSSSRRRESRESSATTGEEVPVLKSKLSISRGEKQQAQINLVSKVEKERVKAPTKSALKAGSSGTLKAGAVPPGLKVAVAANAASRGSKKKGKQQIVLAPETDEDEEEEDEDQNEEEIEDDNEEEKVSDEKDEEDEEDDDEENEDIAKSDEDDADDEENGIVDVKINAGTSKFSGRPVPVSASTGKSVAGKKGGAVSGPTKKLKGGRGSSSATVAAKRLVDSNEDVYGSVPIQTLAISPKIEIKRSSKTSVGTSPPPRIKSNKTSPSSPPPPSPPKKQSTEASGYTTAEEEVEEKGGNENKEENKNTEKVARDSPSPTELATVVVSVSPTIALTSKKKLRKTSVSTGIQAGSSNAKDETKKRSTGTGTNGESETGSSSSFPGGKEVKKKETKVAASNDEKSESKKGKKSSVGTSPPPQSISTQTNEDPGTSVADSTTPSANKSSSRNSIELRSDEYEPPRHVEMSEKAMRYARKARNREQYHQKLKRSLSTQLTYPGDRDPWMDPGEGRLLYRSSSRQSLASDTRSLPLSGPPSRDSSPPPMGRYGGAGSRGGWYEDFRRYPPPPMWESRFGMHPPTDFFTSIDDLMAKRKRDSMRSQEFELTRMLKDAEESNFSPEDVQVGIRMCGDRNPIKWLQENWSSMIETVQSLATKYGREKGNENNDVGIISMEEARDSIRANRGNVWAAVTDCVDQRRKKFHELQSRGTFLREDILTALTASHGNLEAAYVELSKAQLKPFLMRIWGPPTTDTDNESAAPVSSDEGGRSMKLKQCPAGIAEGQFQGMSERSVSLPSGPVGKKERKTSLGNETQVTHLEKKGKLASSAETMEKEEIVIVQTSQEESNEDSTNPLGKSGNTLASQLDEEVTSPALAHHAKSDGEDESFVDAVSEAASTANSPPPLPPPNQSELEEETNESLINESERNSKINKNEDEQDPILVEDEYDGEEDVLEIEIDDTEAHISEFIQNYEILPVAATVLVDDEEQGIAEEVPVVVEEDDNDNSEQEEGDKGISKVEIEQLLTTLTSTFTEMEQFAHKIKENIASEIQQQLAAATGKKSERRTSHDHSEDGSYEPIELPPGIEENVNKKVAKYQRLALKKKQKVARHKSPESHGEVALGEEKEPSVSPLPASSQSQTLDQSKEKQGNEQEDDVSKETKEKEEEEELERATTAASRFSDYEEVEISQEDEEEKGKETGQEEELVEEEEGEFEVEEEDVSPVEESEEEEELMIEAEDGEGDDEEVDEHGGEIYANVEISDGVTVSITPSDTDKIIITGSEMNATAKAIRNQNVNNANNGTVVILSEDISTTIEKTEEKKEEEVVVEKVEDSPAQRLINEGKADNPAQAELALQLIEMNFSEEDSLSAAKECSNLNAALSYLQQECDLCTGKFNAKEMVSMLRCTHLCCRNCARDYFTVQVRDKTILDATCPFCAEPSTLADDSELATEYFNHLDILLKNLLDSKHHEMFQRKLRDWTLAKTPNFKWCSKCSSGFITEPMQTRLVCPDCKAVTCAVCLEPWDKTNHNHRDDVSSKKLCDTAPKSIIEYLNANHIECPRCHFRFSLARGGCMHLTCTQCHHEFCSGCAAPFRMGDKCEAKYPICEKLGLHAHHPRNCLFYLRDKEPDVLSKLLEENAIPYFKENSGAEVESTENSGSDSRNEKNERVCQVPIQRETSDGFADDVCGKEAPAGYATVCKTHYIEYLGLLIWQNHLDPITILTNDDLEVIVRRAFKKHPGRPNWLSDEGFRKRLLRVINDEIPL